MASFGKKILSAFVEVTDDKKQVPDKPPVTPTTSTTTASTVVHAYTTEASVKFKQYFDKLFTDANIPGPDYFEFSKMTEAMNAIADERARYSAAFAGLQVQGLDKQKLLSTAAQYLQVLDTDAANFNATVDTTLQQKVHGKQQEIDEKTKRIQQLSQEITDLQNQIAVLKNEVKENVAKIESNTDGYKMASESMQNRIKTDIEKIKQYIQ